MLKKIIYGAGLLLIVIAGGYFYAVYKNNISIEKSMARPDLERRLHSAIGWLVDNKKIFFASKTLVYGGSSTKVMC